MEYITAEKRKHIRLTKFDKRFTRVLIIIFGLLSVFVAKHLLLARIAVEKAGIRTDNIIHFIKYHVLAFSESFGDLTFKYMLFVSLLLLINVVGLTINKFWKVFSPRRFAITLFLLSIIIAFSIPIEKIYSSPSVGGKPLLMLFCLIMMVPMPYILGDHLGELLRSRIVISKMLYILIYGLLVIQLIIEW